MNRTRWKMMVGALGLSLGGLAAVAGVPSKNGMVSCAGTPTHTVARVMDAPIPVAAPKSADLMPSLPVTPAPATIPSIPSSPSVNMFAVQSGPVPVVSGPVVPTLPSPVPQLALPEPIGPASLAPLQVVPPIPVLTAIPSPIVIDLPKPAPSPLPAPVPPPSSSTSAFPFVSLPEYSKPVPAPVPAPPAVKVEEFIPARPQEAPSPVQVPTPVPESLPSSRGSQAPAVSESRPLEKRLKVILHMGDERPRFEVRDGDEIYLKVVCDRVEVKSPGEGGVSVSTMRASGKVTFTTPGGEGTCEELTVLPGTGQVNVAGKVAFTHNWGKLETTVSGEKMTFRLGSPAPQPSAPTSNAVPTSYSRTR